MQGRHTGYYCDIVTPPRPLDDGEVEVTDLFLDLWVSPDLGYEVLDEEELECALLKGGFQSNFMKGQKRSLRSLLML
jgi:predicted RNA-binding protein associated with RNAse of E/G family